MRRKDRRAAWMRVLSEVVQIRDAGCSAGIQEIRMHRLGVSRANIKTRVSNVHRKVEICIETHRVQESEIARSGRMAHLNIVNRIGSQRARYNLIGALVHRLYCEPGLDAQDIRSFRELFQLVRFGEDLDMKRS